MYEIILKSRSEQTWEYLIHSKENFLEIGNDHLFFIDGKDPFINSGGMFCILCSKMIIYIVVLDHRSRLPTLMNQNSQFVNICYVYIRGPTSSISKEKMTKTCGKRYLHSFCGKIIFISSRKSWVSFKNVVKRDYKVCCCCKISKLPDDKIRWNGPFLSIVNWI